MGQEQDKTDSQANICMIAKYRDSLQNLQQCKQRVMLEDLVAPAGARKKESPKTPTDL